VIVTGMFEHFRELCITIYILVMNYYLQVIQEPVNMWRNIRGHNALVSVCVISIDMFPDMCLSHRFLQHYLLFFSVSQVLTVLEYMSVADILLTNLS
jgi:hypothetical protein